MLTVRRDVLSPGSPGGPPVDAPAGAHETVAAFEPVEAATVTGQAAVGVRSARRRRRRRRFREMLAVLAVLVVLFAATVVVLGLQWLESPSGSGETHPAPRTSNQSLTLHVGSDGPTVKR